MLPVVLLASLALGAQANYTMPPVTGWDGLSATWSLDPLSTNAFYQLPFDMSRQPRGAWAPCDATATDGTACTAKGTYNWLGTPYCDGGSQGDQTLRLLVGRQKHVVGVQMTIPMSNFTAPADMPIYNLITLPTGVSAYAITVYTVYPSKNKTNENDCDSSQNPCYVNKGVDVCNVGRRPTDVVHQGVGSGVWIQLSATLNASDFNSFKSANLLYVPYQEQDAMASSDWTGGNCFRTMGTHYFYKMSASTDCTKVLPVSPIYNGGRLNGFAFWTNWSGDYPTTTPSTAQSKRLEHLTTDDLVSIIGYNNMPSTYFTSCTARTSIHTYFSSYPQQTFNC